MCLHDTDSLICVTLKRLSCIVCKSGLNERAMEFVSDYIHIIIYNAYMYILLF